MSKVVFKGLPTLKPKGPFHTKDTTDLKSIIFWRKGKDPHPQDKIQHDWTLLRTPGRFTTRPLPMYVFYHKKVRSKAVFGP